MSDVCHANFMDARLGRCNGEQRRRIKPEACAGTQQSKTRSLERQKRAIPAEKEYTRRTGRFLRRLPYIEFGEGYGHSMAKDCEDDISLGMCVGGDWIVGWRGDDVGPGSTDCGTGYATQLRILRVLDSGVSGCGERFRGTAWIDLRVPDGCH